MQDLNGGGGWGGGGEVMVFKTNSDKAEGGQNYEIFLDVINVWSRSQNIWQLL